MNALDTFEERWDRKYPRISQSWRSNWANLSPYFKYPQEVRRLIYTTNAIEGFNRQLRKVTKAKSVFPTDDSLLKMLVLAMMDITKKWTGRRQEAQSQILCKLPTRREQIRIQCARQRIYPTAACVQYNAGGDGCQGRRQGRRSSERRAAARRPLTSGPGGVIRACVRQNRWTAVRESGSSPAAVPSTFS